MTPLEKAWKRPGVWSLLLLPLSWIFVYLVTKRRKFQQKYRKSLQLPIVVVGNITVDGTGKTPLLITLVNGLKQRGYHPAVVSRGRGGKTRFYPMQVTADSNPAHCGDEPLLIARSCDCPVIVDPNRYRAAVSLQESGQCDVILSDDGLQHYRLPRSLEIVVIDGERKLGNGRCLPAGPLREPLSRLAEAAFVVVNGGDALVNHPSKYRMDLLPLEFRNLRSGEVRTPKQLPGDGSVIAAAGIGNPTRFARTLASLGLTVKLYPFPDHHAFSPGDLDFNDNRPIIVTAKDAVKCANFANDNVWVLDVTSRLENNGLENLLKAIEALVVTQQLHTESL